VGETGGPPPPAVPGIAYVDGALEPILERGDPVVIEGLGFGATQGAGTVTFSNAAGGGVAAPVAAPADWSDAAVRVTVPDSAVSGALAVTTGDGLRLTAIVHVLPHVVYNPDTLSWQSRGSFPRAPVGVALAASETPSGAALITTLYAAGGAEQIGGGLVPDSGVYLAHVAAGGVVGAWARQRDTTDFTSRVLGAPRAFAAAAIATRYNSRFPGSALYVIGGIDAAGRAQASVLAADVTADSVVARFVPLEPLPVPVAGALAVVKRGRIYVIGGTDSVGHPLQSVFVGRIGLAGHVDGWYVQPSLPAPRAYGGAVVLDGRALAFGGVTDSVPPGGGLNAGTTRLASSDSAAVSLTSGFFTGLWGVGASLLPAGRSQFATLDLRDVVLVVGGMYAGAATNSAETISAAVVGDSLGPFGGPVGLMSISAQGGGTLIGPSGVTWRDADGSRHGLVLGGIDLGTGLRRAGAWGF
jgi:Kelch motif protein